LNALTYPATQHSFAKFKDNSMTEKIKRLELLDQLRKAREDNGIDQTPVHWLFETILERGGMDLQLLQDAIVREQEYLDGYAMYLAAKDNAPKITDKKNIN